MSFIALIISILSISLTSSFSAIISWSSFTSTESPAANGLATFFSPSLGLSIESGLPSLF